MKEDIDEWLDSEALILERPTKRLHSADQSEDQEEKTNLKEEILNALYLETHAENIPSEWKITKLFAGKYENNEIRRAIVRLKNLGFLRTDKNNYIYPYLGDVFVKKNLMNDDLFELYQAAKDFQNSKNCLKDKNFKELYEKVIFKINEEFSRPNRGPVKLLCFKFAVFWALMVMYQKDEFTREGMAKIFTNEVKAILNRNNYSFLQKKSPLQVHGFVSVADVSDPVTNQEFYSICMGEEFEKKLIYYAIKPQDPETLWENYAKARTKIKTKIANTSTQLELVFPELKALLSKTEEPELYPSNPYLLEPFILKPENLSLQVPKKSLSLSIQCTLSGGINSSKITSLMVGPIPGEEEENADSEEERSESGPDI